MATPVLKSKAGGQKVCKKKNLSWLFGTDKKSVPRDYCLASQGFVVPNSDPRTDFSVCTSHP